MSPMPFFFFFTYRRTLPAGASFLLQIFSMHDKRGKAYFQNRSEWSFFFFFFETNSLMSYCCSSYIVSHTYPWMTLTVRPWFWSYLMLTRYRFQISSCVPLLENWALRVQVTCWTLRVPMMHTLGIKVERVIWIYPDSSPIERWLNSWSNNGPGALNCTLHLMMSFMHLWTWEGHFEVGQRVITSLQAMDACVWLSNLAGVILLSSFRTGERGGWIWEGDQRLNSIVESQMDGSIGALLCGHTCPVQTDVTGSMPHFGGSLWSGTMASVCLRRRGALSIKKVEPDASEGTMI